MSAVLQRRIDGTGPGAVEVLAVEGQKAHFGRLWKMLGKDQFVQRECGSTSLLKERKRKSFERDAEKEKQEGIQGQWQQESPAKEFLDQVQSADTDCTHTMMRFGDYALKDGDWEEYKRTFKVEVSATDWAFERAREAFEKVAKDEAESLSIVQGIMLKSTDFLLRIIAPARGQGGVTLSYLCQHCNCFPLEDFFGESRRQKGDSNNKKKQHCSWWFAICGEKYEWRAPQTGYWWYK